MQSSANRFLKRNVPPFRNNRPSSNYGRGKKEQNVANGVCNSKMSFAMKCHNRKDQNEKPRSAGNGASSGHGPNQGLVPLEKTWDKENKEEILTISQERPNQHVTIGTTLTANCKRLLTDVLQENKEVFAWVGSERTPVPRFIMEHQLKIYPLADPVVHKRRPMTPDERQALKERVFYWLKEGTVQVDYSSLNKVCAKDMYPFPEEGKELASLMEYPYKCFLRLPKENSQIRMTENDEEKTGFHTEEGVYCFTHMPKGLKNSAATLQRMMEKVLADQKGRNVEVYLEEIVVKSKSEQSLVQGVEETLRKLKRVNINIYPNTSSFGVEEGRFLGHMVTKEGFIPKLAELKYPINKVRMRLDAATDSGWTNEAKEVLQKIKRKLNKLQTLAILKEREELMLCLRQRNETISLVLMVEREGVQSLVSYYIQRKEAEGSVVKKLSGQGEQVQKTPDANKGETSNLSKKLQAKLTPTTKA
ncbi:reverse transcriptase domain-containing protein [Tanacetum coccineum]